MKVLFFVILLSFNVLAIGISPAGFDVETKTGDIIEKEFYLYNNKDDVKEFEVVVEGYDWFSFFPYELELEANSKEKIKIILEIPGDVSKGLYKGKIYFKEIKSGENIQLNPGVVIPYNIKINEGAVYYDEEDKIEIYQSASVFEKNVNKEIIEEKEIRPEILGFIFLGVVVVILMILAMIRVVRISKGLEWKK